ncbi:MAG: response regulator [Candidatus Omnitrophica bacterium]|nr:response regulator [Candidatus Omnitrophota bacterium]
MTKILIVDDDALVREGFKTILEDFDYELDFAKSAKEAVALFGPKKYRLIFLDLALPDRDGNELLRDFRTADRDVKICVISGYLSKLGNVLEQHDQSAANTMFCMKPINREEIIKITKDNIQN